MLEMKKHGLAVPKSDDVRAAFGDLLTGQVDDLTKIIEETAAAAAKIQKESRVGPIERAKMVEQVHGQARGRISNAFEGRWKRLKEVLDKADKTQAGREMATAAESASAILRHNELRARQVVGSR